MKFVITSLDEVAEALRGEYEARGGKFHLKTEGDFAALLDANTKLAEFRDNNRALNTQLATANDKLKTFDGVDPAEYVQLKTKVTELEGSGIKDKNSVAEIVKAAVKAAVSPLEGKIAEREASEARAQAALAQTTLENQIRDAGMRAGVDERALPDYINRGAKIFKLVDGKAVARNGDNPIFSKTRPADELSLEEWAGELRADAPFLFKTSKGGGAQNNGNNGPIVKKTITADPTEFGLNLESIAKGETTVNPF